MNEKEIAEIRRRYRADKSNITRVRGCFVNEKKEIISEFEQGLGMMNEEEADQILAVMKKTLSGTVGRNLLEMEFSTAQVMESEEHLLLSRLRDSALSDSESVHALYDKLIDSLTAEGLEGNFVILLAADRHDLFSRSSDGEKAESTSVFSYILCCVCPLKTGRPTLSYYLPGNCFRSVCADTVISSPELGFMFPAFEDGGANIYKALYYTKNLESNHEEVINSLFRSPTPMPANAQKSTFRALLESSMEEDCSLKVVRALHTQVCDMIEAQKELQKEEIPPEPLRITKDSAADLLRSCGVSEERVASFEEKYEEVFGKDTALPPKNVIDGTRMHIKTPEVTIRVNPDCQDVLETRVIDGVRYILVRADREVEVNGVNIQI